MSANPEFTLSLHGMPTAAVAEPTTTGFSIEMGLSRVTIFCGNARLAGALAIAVNSVLEAHREAAVDLDLRSEEAA